MNKTCTNCHNSFDCQAEAIKDCWCRSYPALPIDTDAPDCLCPDCLKETLSPQIEAQKEAILSKSVPNKVSELYPPYTKKLIEGIDYYQEGRLMVLTEWYHLRRGYCCGNKCRHCPYDHENVPG